MEFDYAWLLLLPLFFALGWLAARIDIRQLLRDARAVPKTYFRALDLLLKEQPDRALDALQEVAHTHPNAIELQFALGTLYRRKGELDRAIRLHQTLSERDDLSTDIRNDAALELGEDYRRAGLFDRAEAVYRRLLDTARVIDARRALLDIYQQEREWAKAIEMASHLSDASHSLQYEVAQFYCELAHQAMSSSRFDEADRHLDDALAAHRTCTRANLLRGELRLTQGDALGAIDAWLRIEQQDPDFLALAAPRLLEAYVALNKPEEGVQQLRGLYHRHPSLDMLEPLLDRLLADQALEPAYQAMHDEVRRQPSLPGLDRLLQMQLLVAPPERRADLEQLRTLVHQYADRLHVYGCKQCGFKARQYFWHCPGCAQWESYRPLRGATTL